MGYALPQKRSRQALRRPQIAFNAILRGAGGQYGKTQIEQWQALQRIGIERRAVGRNCCGQKKGLLPIDYARMPREVKYRGLRKLAKDVWKRGFGFREHARVGEVPRHILHLRK